MSSFLCCISTKKMLPLPDINKSKTIFYRKQNKISYK